jgi:mannitol/fructose-specific phosphotransferase system IIA component (Ntr-type)
MALEVIRRATLVESNLDEVVQGLIKEDTAVELSPEKRLGHHLPKAIVTVCMTGEGAAKKMESFVREYAERSERTIQVISIGLISMVSMDVEIQRISKKYEILAFVGTLNPEYRQIPYLSIESLYTGDGLSRLNELIQGVDIIPNVEDILDDALIFFDRNFGDKSEAIEFLAEKLLQRGYVDEGFLLSVYRREAITPTFFKGNIAAPHGLPKHVTKPVIAIAKLKSDIVWANGNKIDIIFMIAYKNDSKKYFKNFYRILLNASVIEEIRNCQSAEEIRALVIRNYGFL